VGVDQLVEQIRKVVDVQQVINLASQQTITRELALIKVNSTSTNVNDIVEVGQDFGAQPIDITSATVILEVVGSEEKVNNLIDRLQEYGIREVARSGGVVIARGAGDV
jgi:acetolactate synthase-1/3 small subunit